MQVKVLGHPPPEIKWFHNGQELTPDSPRCSIESNPLDNTFSLIIDKSKVDDSGLYEVMAVNKEGNTSSKAKLYVAAAMDETAGEEAPSFVSGLRDVSADEGQELSLSAPFIGNPVPEAIWSKDGVPLTPSDRVLITCDGRNVGLIIKPAECADSGVYTCLLANPLGEDNYSCQVNVRKVYKKPSFTQKLIEQQQIHGGDAKLTVTVAGVPYPELSWYFNDKPIEFSNSSRYQIKHDGDHHTLTVPNCSESDRGVYKCIATNREGKDLTQGRLDIVDEM